MKPVAYVKYVIGGAPHFVPVIAGVAKIEGYPADYTELFSADQLRQAIDDETQNPWKQAIIDAAVVNWSYKKEHDSNPRAAINDLLAMEDNYVLDPQISERMAGALRQAKVEVLREAARRIGYADRATLYAMADEIERSKT